MLNSVSSRVDPTPYHWANHVILMASAISLLFNGARLLRRRSFFIVCYTSYCDYSRSPTMGKQQTKKSRC